MGTGVLYVYFVLYGTSSRRAVNGVNEEKGSGGGRGTCRLSQRLDCIDTRVWEAGHRPVLSRVSPNCCLRFCLFFLFA